MKNLELFSETLRVVAETTDIPPQTIMSESKQADVVDARHIIIMAQADFLGSSLKDASAVARYVCDVIGDEDQADGFIFNRFYADCVRNGYGIPWEDVL